MDENPEIEPEVDSAPDAEAQAAKIATLEATLIEKELVIDGLNLELVASKAANYDLLMAIPGNAPEATTETEDDTEVDVDDLFGDKD